MFGANLVLVSWLPPDPLNGVLTSYLLRVLREPTGEEVNRTIIPVSLAQQQDAQSVTLLTLELESTSYRVLVSASTRAGRGQSSEPIIIGTEAATTPSPQTTPTTLPDATTETSTTTGENATTPEQPTNETTTQPVTMGTNQTDTNGTDVTPALRDDVYYVVRIVPPVAGGFLLLAVVLIILFCCVHRYTVRKKKKGLYRVQERKKNEYRYVACMVEPLYL